MPTKFSRLGFEKRVIRPDGFYNILLNRKQVGFNLDLRINYYRGLPLSCVQKLEVEVDGEKIPEHLMQFQLREKVFTISELPNMYREYWGSKTPAHLLIYNYGLEPGEHDVNVTLEFKSPYMDFGPGEYGIIDGSAEERLQLGTAREL